MRNLRKKNRCWNLNSRRSRAGHAADPSPIIRNGNISRITAGSVRRSTEQALLQEPARGAGRRLRFRNLFSTGQITARSAGRGSGRLRRLREHAKGVGASSHFRLPLSTGLTFAGNVRQGGRVRQDKRKHKRLWTDTDNRRTFCWELLMRQMERKICSSVCQTILFWSEPS